MRCGCSSIVSLFVTWRTHSCVQRRDFSRRSFVCNIKFKASVELRLDAARTSAYATIENSTMDRLVRFSSLVRKGLRFRRAFEDAKRKAGPQPFDWYPYDCFANLFYMQHLLAAAKLTLDEVVGGAPLLDVGAADGALSFFLESL